MWTWFVHMLRQHPGSGGPRLGELVQELGPERLRGVGLRKMVRAGAELPLAAGTRLARGDIVTLVGVPQDVARVAARLGYTDRPTNVTEMALVGAAVFLGGALGIPALRVRGLELGLSESVGVLLGGLVLGWLRTVNRHFPRLPEAVVALFDSLGLTAFLAVTALAAGPDFVRGLQHSGPSLLVAGLLIVLLPQLLTLIAGKFVFRMHPGIVLGVCCGAGTAAPALAAVQEVARSKVPTLGYGVTYALGNVLLALWPVDFLFRVAEKSSVVLMDGGGFGGPPWSVRVSLANLSEEEYENIGGFMRQAAEEYVEAWKSGKDAPRAPGEGSLELKR